ncbi:LemA family protein [Advenella incenata]
MKRFFGMICALMMAVFLSGCGYNQIQTLDEQVKAAWSETLNQYQRRADLVPKIVASVNAYMVNEREVLTQVTEARSKVGTVQISADTIPTQEQLQQFQAAQNQLGSALSRLIAVSENYPQLKADALFRDLNAQLEGTENRIATARGRYIKDVQAYNTLIRQFPTLITAKIMGYQVKPNFGTDNQDEIMRNPEVKFDTGARAPAGNAAPAQPAPAQPAPAQ